MQESWIYSVSDLKKQVGRLEGLRYIASVFVMNHLTNGFVDRLLHNPGEYGISDIWPIKSEYMFPSVGIEICPDYELKIGGRPARLIFERVGTNDKKGQQHVMSRMITFEGKRSKMLHRMFENFVGEQDFEKLIEIVANNLYFSGFPDFGRELLEIYFG